VYLTDHIKRDPETGDSAHRTIFPDEGPFSGKAWLVSTSRMGARDARTSEVESWDDIYTPEGGS
jgi:hypothetical protein